MRSVPAGRRSSTRAVILAVILIAFSASGLAAGAFAHGIIAKAGGDQAIVTQTGHGGGVPSTATHPTRTPTSPAATATATGAPAATISYPFILHATISPQSVAPGQTFTFTVTAVKANDGATPVAGLKCYLRDAKGSPPLYQQWPAPQVTDTTGTATWTMTAPQAASGQYGIEVVAYGTGQIYAYWDSYMTISS